MNGVFDMNTRKNCLRIYLFFWVFCEIDSYWIIHSNWFPLMIGPPHSFYAHQIADEWPNFFVRFFFQRLWENSIHWCICKRSYRQIRRKKISENLWKLGNWHIICMCDEMNLITHSVCINSLLFTLLTESHVCRMNEVEQSKKIEPKRLNCNRCRKEIIKSTNQVSSPPPSLCHQPGHRSAEEKRWKKRWKIQTKHIITAIVTYEPGSYTAIAKNSSFMHIIFSIFAHIIRWQTVSSCSYVYVWLRLRDELTD